MRGFTLWFTGLPCSGKTTLSAVVAEKLRSLGHAVEQLDGDAFRQKVTGSLGFSKSDREANIVRATEAAASLAARGVITLASFISPYRSMRENARRVIPNFIEVFVRCPVEVCEKRDVKGMYKLARTGRIQSFTGVSDPYEEPRNAEIVVDTDKEDLGSCMEKVFAYLEKKQFIAAASRRR